MGFAILGPIVTAFTFGNMLASLMFIFTMELDGFSQYYTRYGSNNISRLLTGLGFGYAVFSIIVHMVDKTLFLMV